MTKDDDLLLPTQRQIFDFLNVLFGDRFWEFSLRNGFEDLACEFADENHWKELKNEIEMLW